MIKIESKENELYKKLKKLKKKKYRDLYEEYFLEGPNLIKESIKSKVELEAVFVSENNKENKEIQNLLNTLKVKKEFLRIVNIPEKMFNDVSDTVNSQGIIAIVKKRILKIDEIFRSDLFIDKNVLILNNIQDPGNVGTMIRTALGAGYGAVIATRGTADIFSPKVIRVAAGALFKIPIFTNFTDEDIISKLNYYKKEIVATGFNTDMKYYDIDMSKNKALVLGNEGNGVSDFFLGKSQYTVKIPMNNELESLNVAISAGIIMYETVRRNI